MKIFLINFKLQALAVASKSKICRKFGVFAIMVFMPDFWIFFKIGLRHVLDINGYDHLLFLIALTVPFVFRDWRRILALVSVFTLGHTLSLILSVFNVVSVNSVLVEFLIPCTILAAAIFSLVTAGKTLKHGAFSTSLFITGFFGIIHGLGFSTYLKTMLPGTATDKLAPVVEFALGIEAAQIIIVIAVLLIAHLVQTLGKFSRRDWTLTAAAFVAGVVVPIIIESEIWK